MSGSIVVYAGLVGMGTGAILAARRGRRRRGLAIIAMGAAIFFVGMMLPAPESRAARQESRLDEFAPVWQFNEYHQTRVAAPPTRVFEAIRNVRAEEILLFRTLTAIRRFGKPQPESILNAPKTKPIIDVATGSGFIKLADDSPREIVIGTVVVAPRGARGRLTPEVFRKTLPPGFALATMNFRVVPDGDGSLVTTETRVFANSDDARRRFAGYWRIIYPGSALIRRMWLRAIERRATSTQ